MQADVLIVGGGPAGAAVAKGLSKNGFSVIIVEEHREIGRPVQCSGLVSPRVLEIAGSSRRVRFKPCGMPESSQAERSFSSRQKM